MDLIEVEIRMQSAIAEVKVHLYVQIYFMNYY